TADYRSFGTQPMPRRLRNWSSANNRTSGRLGRRRRPGMRARSNSSLSFAGKNGEGRSGSFRGFHSSADQPKGGLQRMKSQHIILLALIIVVAAFTGTATAQFTLDQDVLGAHNINGRGCVSCHQPHSGSAGAGGTDTSTGTIVLWGRSFLGKTYTSYGGVTFTTYQTVSSFINGTKDPLYRTAICLTCHDGSASITGMHGTTVETVDGGSAHAPTYLATDAEGLTNDHPVHIPYVPAAAPGGKHWAGT